MAALIIAVMALVASTASVAIQITLFLIHKKEKAEQPQMAFAEWDPESLNAPSKKEALAVFEKDPNKAMDEKFNDAFASSDQGFTGIDESFGV